MNRITIRPAGLCDTVEIIMIQRAAIETIDDRIYPASLRQAWRDETLGDLRHLIVAGRYRVAESAGVLVGGAGWEESEGGEGATIRAVFVHPAAHGRGVGARLLGSIEEALAGRGITRMIVPAALNAIGFYERLGYRAAERRAADLGGVQLPYQRMIKEAA
jgi:GNAT superfamily N-acetyltransferase